MQKLSRGLRMKDGAEAAANANWLKEIVRLARQTPKGFERTKGTASNCCTFKPLN